MASQSGSVRSTLNLGDVMVPQEVVSLGEATWQGENKRRKVARISPAPEVAAPARFSVMPEWPGTGVLTACTDALPLVTIPGMPAETYPAYVKALAMYSLADMVVQHPHLWAQLQRPEAVRMAVMVVAVRAGCWAALRRAPECSETASSVAVRWSARLGELVTVSPTAGDGTELWRQFLASSPGIPAVCTAIAKVLPAVGQMCFLLGAARLCQSGDIYAMHLMQREVHNFLAAALDPAALGFMRLDVPATWDVVSAAAIGGYRVSVIKSLSTSISFSLSAHVRIAGDDKTTVQAQLERVVSCGTVCYQGFPPVAGRQAAATEPMTNEREESDDTESIADTVAALGISPQGSGASTPRRLPDFDEEVIVSLREAIGGVPPMAPAIGSIAAMQVEQCSIGDF